MIHVVAYDIADGKRLARVARLCEDFGVRIEKSVFEMKLSPARFDLFWRKISGLIDDEEDSLIDYPVSAIDTIRTIGKTGRPEQGCLVF